MLSTILQAIIAIPQIINAIISIISSVKKMNESKKKVDHDNALQKYKDAKNAEEQKKALDELVDNP